MIDHTNRGKFPLPILSTLEKRIVLVLGTDIESFNELSRYSAKDIKIELNKYYEIYHQPYCKSVPYSTLRNLEAKGVIETVITSNEEHRRVKYYLLTEGIGIDWYYRLKEIEQKIFSNSN